MITLPWMKIVVWAEGSQPAVSNYLSGHGQIKPEQLGDRAAAARGDEAQRPERDI
jgi:hypothetical protein